MKPTEVLVDEAPQLPQKRPLNQAAVALLVLPHLLAGVKQAKRWDGDTLVTDAELQAAVADVLSIRIG